MASPTTTQENSKKLEYLRMNRRKFFTNMAHAVAGITAASWSAKKIDEYIKTNNLKKTLATYGDLSAPKYTLAEHNYPYRNFIGRYANQILVHHNLRDIENALKKHPTPTELENFKIILKEIDSVLSDESSTCSKTLSRATNIILHRRLNTYAQTPHLNELVGKFIKDPKDLAQVILNKLYNKDFPVLSKVTILPEGQYKNSDPRSAACNRPKSLEIYVGDSSNHFATVLSVVHEIAHNAITKDITYYLDIINKKSNESKIEFNYRVALEEAYCQGCELIASQLLLEHLQNEIEKSELNPDDKQLLKNFFYLCEQGTVYKYSAMLERYYDKEEDLEYASEVHHYGMAILDALTTYIMVGQDKFLSDEGLFFNSAKDSNAFVEALNWIQSDKALPPILDEYIANIKDDQEYLEIASLDSRRRKLSNIL